MKTDLSKIAAAAAFWAAAIHGHAQGTTFTYQGRLNDASAPAQGLYDFGFKLFADPLATAQVGTTALTNALPVTNGLFTVAIDFGPGIFTGSNYWLGIDVRTNGSGGYASLTPLQPVTPAPYALFAGTARALSGGLGAGDLSGSYSNAVAFSNPANTFAGTFTGNGAGLTNLNALTLSGLPASAFWQLGGNYVAPGQFLGSTNNQPVEIWANGARALRFEPNTNGAPNLIGGAPVNYVDPGIVGATIAGGGNVSGNFYLGGGPNHVAAIFGTIAGGRVNTVAGDHAFIGGGISNTVQAAAYDGVIGGGVANALGNNVSESAIVGGTYNAIQQYANYSFIGGGSGNLIQTNSQFSVIAGGGTQSIQPGSGYSFIGGGYNNSIQSNGSSLFIGGGARNLIQAGVYDATLVGGALNAIQAYASYSFLGGGYGNSIQSNATFSVLAGGFNNTLQTNASYNFLGGGSYNSIRSNATYSVIAGGYNNLIQTNSQYATIGGGFGNSASGNASLVAGGFGNINTGPYSGISGGYQNRNGAQFGTVGGGSGNTNGGYSGTISGGQNNVNTGYASAIGGGQGNSATNQTATVAGGWNNLSGGVGATVGGGYNNRALVDYTTVSGGYSNSAPGYYSFAGGGIGNNANGTIATLSGGSGNAANGYGSAISGGWNNAANGFGAVVPGGSYNTAAGDYSFAAGYRANAAGHHSFVFNSFPNPNYPVGTNEFFIFAENGLSIDYNNQVPFGGGDRWLYIGKGFGGFGVPATIITWTGAYLSDGGAWTSASDRARKANFAPIDPQTVLAKVAALPIQTWNYTNEPPAIRHLGPVAQDFHAAFALNGDDNTHISSVDEAGVALAAIQALNQKQDQDRAAWQSTTGQIQQLKAQNRTLTQRVADLEALVATLARKTQ